MSILLNQNNEPQFRIENVFACKLPGNEICLLKFVDKAKSVSTLQQEHSLRFPVLKVLLKIQSS